MTEHQRRIARARLLRRQGKTYAEIRAVVGDVSDDRLATWLAGIPRPPETRLSHPLTELRRECRRLRLEGLSYSQIAAITGASTGSLSLWLRDLRNAPSVRKAAKRHALSGPKSAGAGHARVAAKRRAERQQQAAEILGAVSTRDLRIAGAVLYWAEGSKAKPWRPNDRRITFTNSDVDVIRLFLRWLDIMGVPLADRMFRLLIHQSADVAVQQEWWSEQLRVPLDLFQRATLKRHNPTTVRRNTNEHYHGCLVVRVRCSGALYDAVEGTWQALVSAAMAST